MSTAQFIDELQNKRISLVLVDQRLKITAPAETATADLKKQLLSRKPEIVSYLIRHIKNEAEYYHERYEERAGICEYDGGMTRNQAEGAAYEDTLYQWIYDHPLQRLQYGYCCQCNRTLPRDHLLAYGETYLCNQQKGGTCLDAYLKSRRAEATTALSIMKIVPSTAND